MVSPQITNTGTCSDMVSPQITNTGTCSDMVSPQIKNTGTCSDMVSPHVTNTGTCSDMVSPHVTNTGNIEKYRRCREVVLRIAALLPVVLADWSFYPNRMCLWRAREYKHWTAVCSQHDSCSRLCVGKRYFTVRVGHLFSMATWQRFIK